MSNKTDVVVGCVVDAIQDAHWSFRASRVLHAAEYLGFFRFFQGNGNSAVTALEVANKLGTNSDFTERLLIALCAMNVLANTGDHFHANALTARFFSSSQEEYQGDLLLYARGLWDYWTNLEEVVQFGPLNGDSAVPSRQRKCSHESFVRAMHNAAVLGPARVLAEVVNLSGNLRLLDVGGGPGTYSIFLCRKFPGLTCDIIDLPSTLRVTEHYVSSYGLEKRIRLRPADWKAGEFGLAEYDAVLLSQVLHGKTSDWQDLLHKAFQSLQPNGQLLIHDFLLNPERNGPLGAALFNLMVDVFSEHELLGLLKLAGFAEPSIRARLSMGTAIVHARKVK